MSIDDYIHHPLNNSTSKNVCHFTRNRRFHPDLSPKTHDLSYQLPDFKSKRTCSFGIGDKSVFLTKSTSPPPNNYNIKGSFRLDDSKGFTFGVGRDLVTFGSVTNIKKRTNTLPGPGEYPLPSTLASNKIYMGIKLESVKNASKDVPGPGFYSLKQTQVRNSGRYVLSNFQNPLSPTWRSRTLEIAPSSTKFRQSTNLGPGSYEATDNLNASGRYFQTRYKSSKVRSFSKSRRQSMLDKARAAIPGPGTYKSFSQFGNTLRDLNKTNFHVRLLKQKPHL